MRYALLLIAVPMIEIALFIQVGSWLGVVSTLALVILSAAIGLAVVRVQGAQALLALRRNIESGGDPSGPFAHGAMILVAGILLLVPGFLSDAIGIALLFPPTRRWLVARGAGRMSVKAARFRKPAPQKPTPGVIDAEFEVLDDETPRRPGTSGWTRPED